MTEYINKVVKFVRSKKNIKKEKPQAFQHLITIPQSLRDSSLYTREPFSSDYYLFFLFAVGAIFTSRITDKMSDYL